VSAADPVPTEADPGPEMSASRLIRIPALWISPIVISSILIFLMTLIYIGSVVDPLAHLHGLPVLVVNEDVGATIQSGHIEVGQQVASGLEGSTAVSSRLSLRSMTLAQARNELNENAAYTAIFIPADLTRSLLSLYGGGRPAGQSASIPTIQLLTNGRSGSIGVSLATGVAQPALKVISQQVGHQLSTAGTGTAHAGTDPYLTDPIAVTTVPFRPLPPHSALGLSAFYISLLTIMCGFLGATLVNSTVDAALGYASSEIGPKWRQRRPVRISRWQTLLVKWIIALGLVPLLTALLLVVSIGILGMDASHIGYLWAFTSIAAVVVAIGTLVLFAAFGALGQLLGILVFVYLALASSGGTIPLQALPGVLKLAANVEPLRQVLDGVRAILYFNAAGDAGLTRGVVMTGIGLVFWVVAGIVITVWYDRKKLYRMQPDLLSYVNRSVETYVEGRDPELAATKETS
jgi:YhgE/Pip-like protein